MKFSVMQPTMHHVLKMVVPAAKGDYQDILIEARDGRVSIKAANLHVQIIYVIGGDDVTILEDGAISIYGRGLLEYIQTMPDDMRLNFVAEEVDQKGDERYDPPEELVVKCGKYAPKFKLYPIVGLLENLNSPDATDLLRQIDADDWKDAVDHVIFAAARVGHHQVLEGVRIDIDGPMGRIMMEAADGHCLSWRWIGKPGSVDRMTSWMATQDYLRFCQKSLSRYYGKINLYASRNDEGKVKSQTIEVFDEHGRMYISGGVVWQLWIDTREVVGRSIGKRMYFATVDIGDLRHALEAIYPFVESELTRPIDLVLPGPSGCSIEIFGRSEIGDSRAEVVCWNVSNAELVDCREWRQVESMMGGGKISFDCKKFLDLVKNVDGDELHIMFDIYSADAGGSVFFVDEKQFLHILMPIVKRGSDE